MQKEVMYTHTDRIWRFNPNEGRDTAQYKDRIVKVSFVSNVGQKSCRILLKTPCGFESRIVPIDRIQELPCENATS